MKAIKISGLILIFCAAVFSSCSDYNKILKSTDYNNKYDAAIKYYEKGDYSKSLGLLEELVSVYRGTEKGQKIMYYYAYATYFSSDYILAGYHFNNFVKTFPAAEKTEECAFMYAYCYYLESPGYSLDQTDSRSAIKELQFFINKYPESQRISQCNELIGKLRIKLEQKYFKISQQYYFLDDYKAAVVSFENVLKEFPDTQYREEIMFMIIKSNYIFATKSFDNKKADRFKSTISSYNKFVSYYPSSAQYGKNAEGYFSSAKKQLENIEKQ